MCALAPVVGRPLAALPLWQVVQLLVLVTFWWLNAVGFHAVVVWQLEQLAYAAVEMWLAFAGVNPLPAGVLWHVLQSVTPLWFIVAGVHTLPIAWQLPQVALAIVSLCACAPLLGIPACGAALVVMPWQPEPVQVLPLVTPAAAWSKLLAGFQAVVAWQTEHWEAVVTWLAFATVQPLPV